jgi:hypothetical protein
MRAIVTGAVMALTITTAGAQSPLTLACAGTVKDNILGDTEKVQTGLIVNFQTRQITGILGGWNARIDQVDDATIDFSGIISVSERLGRYRPGQYIRRIQGEAHN